MFESKNLYVLNKKDSNAIVYEDADGCIIRLTRDMFATQEEFDQWKKWSDEDYHTEEKARHLFTDHTLSLEGLSDEAAATASSPEDDFFSTITEAERTYMYRLLEEGCVKCLTAVQYRRMKLYYVHNLKEAEIASIEGVDHRRISNSLLSARKKLKKFFENRGSKPRFFRDR